MPNSARIMHFKQAKPGSPAQICNWDRVRRIPIDHTRRTYIFDSSVVRPRRLGLESREISSPVVSKLGDRSTLLICLGSQPSMAARECQRTQVHSQVHREHYFPITHDTSLNEATWVCQVVHAVLPHSGDEVR